MAVGVGRSTWTIERVCHGLRRRGDVAFRRWLTILDGIRSLEFRGSDLVLSEQNPGFVSVLATVSHWRAQASALGQVSAETSEAARRLHCLLSCLDAVLGLSAERIAVVVISNQPQATAADLVSNAARLPPDVHIAGSVNRRFLRSARGHVLRSARQHARLICCLAWSPGWRYRHPYYLTWAHKPVLAEACKQGLFTHYVYLEDDIRFTDQAFSYWRATRRLLAPHGLIPGFARYEHVNGHDFIIDQRDPPHDNLPRLTIPPEDTSGTAAARRFVNLENPYQAMYIMDDAMAREHFRCSPARTPYRSRSLIRWGNRERAAIGPIFDHVPPTFGSRNVVPLHHDTDEAKPQIARSCLIEHVSANSTRRIRVEELFGA